MFFPEAAIPSGLDILISEKTFLQLQDHLLHLSDTTSWCTIVYSLVLNSTKEIYAVLIDTFVVHSLKIGSSVQLISE